MLKTSSASRRRLVPALVAAAASLLLPLLFGVPAAGAVGLDDEWPMFHHDPSHSGYSTSPAPNTKTTAWVKQFRPTGAQIMCSPAVAEGKVFFGTVEGGGMGSDGTFYAVDAETSATIWSFDAGAPVYSSPAVANGLVYFLDQAGVFHALDTATGAQRWSRTGLACAWSWSSPAVSGGRVFVAGGDNYMPGMGALFAFDAQSGAQVWKASFVGMPNPMIAVANGKVYTGTHGMSEAEGATLHAFRESDGGAAWTYRYATTHSGFTGMINHNGVTVADGDADGVLEVYFTVYVFRDGVPPTVPTPTDTLVCVDEPTGVQEWTKDLGGNSTSTPAIHNGVIFVGHDGGGVGRPPGIAAVDATTRVFRWRYPTSDMIWGAPAVADGKVYVGGMDHYFYCLDEVTGALVWRYDTFQSRLHSSPAIAYGKVYVGNESGKLYCFGAPYAPPINHPPLIWPADSLPVDVPEGTPGTKLGFAFDEDGDALGFSASEGTVAYLGGGMWVWTRPTTDDVPPHNVTVTASDGEGGSASTTFVFGSHNVAPNVVPPGDATVAEGGTYSATCAFTDPGADGWYAMVDWGDGTQGMVSVVGHTIPLAHTYLVPGSYPVKVTLSDDDGGTDEALAGTVAVTNAAPSVSENPAGGTIAEGGTYSGSLTWTDPGGGGGSVTVEWGDGSSDTYASSSGVPLAISHTYAENGSFTPKIGIDDHEGAVTTIETLGPVVVQNVAPDISTAGGSATDHGVFSGTVTFGDPGPDAWTGVVDWGDGTRSSYEGGSGDRSFSIGHAYEPGGPYEVSLCVTDDDGGSSQPGDCSFTISGILGHDPTVTGVGVPLAPIPVDTSMQATATFTDPQTGDVHTAVWDWGDGTSGPDVNGVVTESGGAGRVDGSHTYLAPGIYSVSVTVTDDDDHSASGSATGFVVVYDPSAGFVTGGGWIDSPAGAMPAQPTLSGRANFGFVSKYRKGATVPEGSTEFQFKAGDINFHSSTYEWLIVAGTKATFRGVGTVNGVPGYRFVLAACDEAAPKSDAFRIRITSAGGVLYDNLVEAPNAPDDADPTTVLGGGNIVIHR